MRSSFGGRVSKADGNTDAFCNGNLAPTTVVILVVKLWYYYPKKRWVCKFFTVSDRTASEPSLTYKNRVENGQTLQSSNLFIQWVNQYHRDISWNHRSRQLIWILLFLNIEICVLSSASALFSYCSLFKLMRPSQETKGTLTPQGATRTSTTPSRARTTTRARLAATTIPGVRLAVPLPRLHLHKFIYWLWRLVAAIDAMIAQAVFSFQSSCDYNICQCYFNVWLQVLGCA